MAPNTETNIWAQMSYAPPRGQCNYKPSLMSAKCPCLRFMLHPLKSSSTFECDGCSHHASFHNLENKAEDEVRKRWEVEQKAKEAEAQLHNASKSRKRPRLIEGAATTSNGRLLIEEHAFEEMDNDQEGSHAAIMISTRSKAPAKSQRGKEKRVPLSRPQISSKQPGFPSGFGFYPLEDD
ncbi:uncharacterized protein BDZ99DRAFT_383278 [Mytilinidion resinicola]|uniref:Uncharacterized protein n=1 Tax=Mytilinidion resinicola TaxID=574789 RepID=A0A6A6YT36_9PEZI|nr:uncharacterized protein BDZ99DRAFT_383278 [Mytilinidion resinicola]KAF2812082.1 hypothetical protein BDZ99DRAFT_383278 [Mytilinidion resinicola]